MDRAFCLGKCRTARDQQGLGTRLGRIITKLKVQGSYPELSDLNKRRFQLEVSRLEVAEDIVSRPNLVRNVESEALSFNNEKYHTPPNGSDVITEATADRPAHSRY